MMEKSLDTQKMIAMTSMAKTISLKNSRPSSKKTLLYFSLDDPFLSDADLKNSSHIRQHLDQAKKNPHLYVFDPEYGFHVGVFFDPIFPDFLRFTFSDLL